MRKLIFLLIIFLFNIAGAMSQDVTFKATAPGAVVVGQQFRLTYTCNKEGKDFRGPDLPDFDVLFGPVSEKSQRVEVINNQTTVSETTYSYTYTLMAKREGTFTVPPASIKIGNSEYKSNQITIKVLPKDKEDDATAQQASSGSTNVSAESLFVRMHVSKTSVYENEGFLVTFKLYSLYGNVHFESVKFPEFEGFIVQEVELPEQKQLSLESYNGRNYQAVVLRQVILYPQHSGKITIGSGKYDAVVQVRSQQRSRSIFDDFFDSTVPVKKQINSPAATIDVKTLPANKPASFNGAVGDYTMTSKISSNSVKANESVTIRVTISGSGNIKLIANPNIVFPNDFEVYDPKVETNTKVSASGVTGNKTIEYLAIPRYAGDFTIPKAEFSYFDTKTGTYKTLSTEEFQLHVDPAAEGSAAPALFNTSNKEDVKFIGKDIRYIKTKDIAPQLKREFFFGQFSYWLCYIIPALLFIIFFIIYRKQAAENANIALVRTKKANKVASKRLKVASKLLKESKKEAFYDEMLKAVWGYLSDKLNIPVASLTKDNVENELGKYGVTDELTQQFMDILNTCEFARFAPAQGSEEMDKLYASTVQAIDKMENIIKK